jgi:predicted RNA-binding protein with PUA-like domain
VTEKQVVGLARVAREAYPDPTATEGDWSCVDLEPAKPLKTPVTLETIKADPALQEMKLLRQSRLSVSPLTAAEFSRLLALAGTKP